MADFVVHGVPGSPYVRVPLLVLEEKGAAWKLDAFGPGDMRSARHLAMHPFGRIPILDHGDFRLYEAQAIARYLDRLLPQPELTPRDPRREARMNQLMGIADWYVMPDVSSGISFGRVVAPRFGMPTDEARIAAAVPHAKRTIGEVADLLGRSAYLTGESLTLADLQLIPQLDMFEQAPEGKAILEPHPNLRAWIERMRARPSVQRTAWDRLLAG